MGLVKAAPRPAFQFQRVVASIKRGTPIVIPKYYNPDFSDPPNSTLIFKMPKGVSRLLEAKES